MCVAPQQSDLAVTYGLFAAVLQPDDVAIDCQMCGYCGVNVRNTPEILEAVFSTFHWFLGGV